MDEWQEALTRLQSDVIARPLKQDVEAMTSLMERQVKLLSRRLNRLSSHQPVDSAGSVHGDATVVQHQQAAAMKKKIISDFNCLSCDKKLLFTRQECVTDRITHIIIAITVIQLSSVRTLNPLTPTVAIWVQL